MIIGSIAPAYRPEKRIRGHVVSFQSSLRSAALSRGDEFKILVPEDVGSSSDDGIIPYLPDRRDPVRCLTGVRRWLSELEAEDQVVVVLYEGALRWLSAFDALATDHPDVIFLVNLFVPEAGLDAPTSSRAGLVQPSPSRIRELEHRSAVPPGFRQAPRSNVAVLAETEERRFLAEAIGIRTAGVWPLHSPIASIDPPGRTMPATDAPLRVLIPIAPRQVKPRLMREVEFVTRQVDRSGRDRPIHWTLLCPSAVGAPESVRIRQMLRTGLSLVDDALEPPAYAALFSSHDAVWFPFRGQYTTQSSGKALDALVAATPIVAPAGSYAAKQQQRWLPGAPAYDGSREAIELLLRLHALAPTWQRQLRAISPALRDAYSAETALERLTEVATAAAAARGGPPESRPAEPEGQFPDEPIGRSRKHLMRLAEAADLSRAFVRFLRQ